VRSRRTVGIHRAEITDGQYRRTRPLSSKEWLKRDAAKKPKVNPYPGNSFAADLARGRWDVEFFAKRFLGINGNPGQLRLWKAYIARDKTRWRAAYLTISASAGNRAGKTLGLAIVVFHSAVYKMGMEPPDGNDDKSVERWMNAPYEWYHFAIQQEVSELLYHELVRVLRGQHEAQGPRGCPLTRDIAEPVEFSKKYRGEYLWMVIHPLLGGAEIHFRTTNERAFGSLGKDMNGISFDECAFDPHLQFVLDEVLNLRRLGTGGQLFLISTPTEGITVFADIWELGNPDAPDRKPNRHSLRMSTRENVGYGIDSDIFDKLVADMPPGLVPQNIDGHFIEGVNAYFNAAAIDHAFVTGLPELVAARPKHRYVNGVDPALRHDSTWALVLDVTDPDHAVGVKAVRARGKQQVDHVVGIVADNHHAYNTPQSWCSTAIDATGFGGKMFKDALSHISPLRSVEFGGTRAKKLKLLSDTRTMLDRGMLKFPRSGPWLILRRQLLGYKLDDKGLETDAVMALVVAVNELKRTPGQSTESLPFDFFQTDEVPPGVPSWLRLPKGATVLTTGNAWTDD
jgi:hypothetical protein